MGGCVLLFEVTMDISHGKFNLSWETPVTRTTPIPRGKGLFTTIKMSRVTAPIKALSMNNTVTTMTNYKEAGCTLVCVSCAYINTHLPS